jgi:hypothetical protein
VVIIIRILNITNQHATSHARQFSDTCSSRKAGTAHDDGSGGGSGVFVFVLAVLIAAAVIAGLLFYVKQKSARASETNLVLLNDYAQASAF